MTSLSFKALSKTYEAGSRVRTRLDFWTMKAAIGLGVFPAYQPIPDLNIRIKSNREAGVFERWKAIRRELPESPGSVLDIGCNVGHYVIESAKLGHMAAGLDTPAFAGALSTFGKNLGLQNVIPISCRLDPDNVKTLPVFDCIILLQVFHHLCRAYGREQGIEMVRQICAKATTRLIFETEPTYKTNELFQPYLPDMGNDAEAWVQNFFRDMGCKDVRVIFRDDERQRVVVAVDK